MQGTNMSNAMVATVVFISPHFTLFASPPRACRGNRYNNFKKKTPSWILIRQLANPQPIKFITASRKAKRIVVELTDPRLNSVSSSSKVTFTPTACYQ